MNQAVGILGGMGPTAGAEFALAFVRACTERLTRLGMRVEDQAYPEHWLVQAPIANRVVALTSPGADPGLPLHGMKQAMTKLHLLGAQSVAIACNTAHAWHADIQAEFPDIELLHIVHELVCELKSIGVQRIGLLATQGTYASGVYAHELKLGAIQCALPSPLERAMLMEGIFHGVKADDIDKANACFSKVANGMCERNDLQALVLGCTEIPLGLRELPRFPGVRLINPANTLARALAYRAIPAVAR